MNYIVHGVAKSWAQLSDFHLYTVREISQKCTGVVCHFPLHWPCIPVYMVVHVLLEYSGPRWPLGGGDIFRQKELAMRKCGDRAFLVWGIISSIGLQVQIPHCPITGIYTHHICQVTLRYTLILGGVDFPSL